MTQFAKLRTSLAASTALAAALTFAPPAMAQSLPDTGNVSSVTSGLSGGAPGSTNPTFSNPNANTLQVDLKDNRTILNWTGGGFTVAGGNTVDFKDARAASGVTGRTDNIAVLNRVVGSPAIVNGTLRSDPNVAVYLISQDGVMFGAGAVVDTGALFASGIDLTNDNDFLSGATTLRFAIGNGTVGTNPGAQFTTHGSASSSGGRMGDLVMIGSRIVFNGFGGTKSVATVAGDAALIVTKDVQVVSQAGSPLSFTINAGSTFDPSLFVGGDITAANIVLAQTQAGSMMGPFPSIDLSGNLVATGAAATDRGIVLTTGAAAAGVAMGITPGTDYGAVIKSGGDIKQTGTITSAKGLNVAAGTFTANGKILVGGRIDFVGQILANVMTPPGGADWSITGSEINFAIGASLAGKVTATTGNITANGDTSFGGGLQAAGNVNVTSTNFSVANGISVGGTLTANTVNSTVLLGGVNAGAISINSTGTSGYVSISDATSTIGDISIGSAYTLSTGNVTAADAVRLRGDFTLTAGAVSGSSVSLRSGAAPFANAEVGTITATSLTARAGDADVAGKIITVTSTSAANDVTINATGNLALGGTTGSGTTSAGRDIILSSTGGTTTVRGTVTAGRDAAISGYGFVTLGNGGTAASMMKSAGSFSATSLSGNVRGVGALTLQSNSDGVGNEALTLTGVTGPSLTPASALLGGTARQSDVQIRFTQPATISLGRIEARALLGASDATSPFSNGLVSTAPVALRGPVSLVNTLSVSANQIVLAAGNAVSVSNGGIDLRSTSALSIVTALSASGDITAQSTGGDLGIAVTGSLTGQDVLLSTPGAFLNSAGAGTVTARGHWVVYSANPTGNSFGGLDSGNTAIWGAALASRDPSTVSGNRYVFAYQPTLTFSTGSISKSYGTALSGNAIPYTVSGYDPGVAGAYLGDTAATAFSGSPVFASAGFAERATVAGGPYALTLDVGSVQSLTGYALAASPGTVTVTPKALTLSVQADNKIYDGTTVANGTITLNGALSGDSVAASAALAFADKNAGTGKIVNVISATLTGADAGNYTVVLPGNLLADILKKAIAASVAADGKTYDGSTAATGTVSLGGVVAGDTVGTSGTVLAFADKNAGTDKTVNVSVTTLTGGDAGNYTLTVPATVLADILKKAVTASVVADGKTYDGSTAATGTVSLDGVVAGDGVDTSGTVLAFADKNAGTGKTVNISGTTLTGADGGNYTLAVPASATANILTKEITGTVTVAAKTYDGSTVATGSVSLAGVVAGDAVGTSGTVLAFGDKNAGIGKTVNVSGTTLTGGDAGNYTLTIASSAKGDILKRTLGITAIDAGKLQNEPDPMLSYALVSGSLVAGDALSGDPKRAAGEQPGNYVIDIGSLSAGTNYEIQFQNGVFTIHPLAPASQTQVQPFRSVTLPAQLPDLGVGMEEEAVRIDGNAVCGEDKGCTSDRR